MILKTAANYNDEGGYIEAWKNSDGTTEVKLIPKSGGDEGSGLLSISISPAIETTPALDSLFPIYWDDLPEGEIEEGVEYRYYEQTLHTGHALTQGDDYSVSITPTSEWHYDDTEDSGGDGETVTLTKTVAIDRLSVTGKVFDHENVKSISVNILITE